MMFTETTERMKLLSNERTVIIGAGAAGMMAGIFSANRGNETIILEKNKRPGRKLYITGKGRCNVCNNCNEKTVIANTPTNGKFLFSALNAFSPEDTIEFFEKHGCPLKTERGNRVFPVSDKAGDIVDTLLRTLKGSGCKTINTNAEDILIKDNQIYGVILADKTVIECDKLIIATGGKSYPLTGSTGDGYRFAEKAGHTITTLRPSLVPVETAEHTGYDSDGLLLKNVSVRLIDTFRKNKCIYNDFGEFELHRYGLSGAIIRSADQFSADLILLPERRSAAVNETVIRVASGSAQYVTVSNVVNLSKEINSLKDAGFWIYGADMSGNSSYETAFSSRSVLVMGSEGSGIRPLVRSNCDYMVRIPMSGHIDSLNVSVSAGILMYEYRRKFAG